MLNEGFFNALATVACTLAQYRLLRLAAGSVREQGTRLNQSYALHSLTDCDTTLTNKLMRKRKTDVHEHLVVANQVVRQPWAWGVGLPPLPLVLALWNADIKLIRAFHQCASPS